MFVNELVLSVFVREDDFTDHFMYPLTWIFGLNSGSGARDPIPGAFVIPGILLAMLLISPWSKNRPTLLSLNADGSAGGNAVCGLTLGDGNMLDGSGAFGTRDSGTDPVGTSAPPASAPGGMNGARGGKSPPIAAAFPGDPGVPAPAPIALMPPRPAMLLINRGRRYVNGFSGVATGSVGLPPGAADGTGADFGRDGPPPPGDDGAGLFPPPADLDFAPPAGLSADGLYADDDLNLDRPSCWLRRRATRSRAFSPPSALRCDPTVRRCSCLISSSKFPRLTITDQPFHHHRCHLCPPATAVSYCTTGLAGWSFDQQQ